MFITVTRLDKERLIVNGRIIELIVPDGSTCVIHFNDDSTLTVTDSFKRLERKLCK